MPADAELRVLVATLERALSVAHAQVREARAVAERANRLVGHWRSRAEGLEVHCAKLRKDCEQAQRDSAAARAARRRADAERGDVAQNREVPT